MERIGEKCLWFSTSWKYNSSRTPKVMMPGLLWAVCRKSLFFFFPTGIHCVSLGFPTCIRGFLNISCYTYEWILTNSTVSTLSKSNPNIWQHQREIECISLMELGHEGWCVERRSGRKEALDIKRRTFNVLKISNINY